ncbi:GLUG motif-containing protein [Clostridiaceae bacterium 35-E11]
MHTKIYRKFFAFLLSLMMVLSMSVTSFAQMTDISSHWAKNAISYFMSKGIIGGYPDKEFKPDKSITRAEFFKIINNIFGYADKTEISFNDVKDTDWYYAEIQKAVAAGYIHGYPNNTIRPNGEITRQEAATVIATTFGLDEKSSNSWHMFNDNKNIANWARPYVGAIYDKGFVAGYKDKTYRPENKLTRAEAITTISNGVTALYNTSGVYSQDVNGNAIVNTTEVTLKDMTISGDLYLAEGIGNGDAVLEGVTVKGKTFVRGGGENSIHIRKSSLTEIVSKKAKGKLRIVFSGRITIPNLIINNNTIIVIEKGVTIKHLQVNERANIQLSKDATIENAVINATDVKITGKGNIKNLKINKNMQLNDKNVEKGKEVEVKEGKIVGKEEKPKNSGGSGSGGTTASTVSVTEVSLNKASAAVTVGNTLQLTAIVAPRNADNKKVTWATSNDDVATVNKDGLVTAVNAGEATITVTTVDKNKTATCIVTVVERELEKYHTTFTVMDAVYNPIAGASIEVKGPSDFKDSKDTDDDGEAVFNLVSGDYDYTVTKSVYESVYETVSDSFTLNREAMDIEVIMKQIDEQEEISVSSVLVDPTEMTLTMGETQTITYTITPSNATDKRTTWSSSNTDVATVVSGEVTAEAEGIANITVTTKDGNKTATCTVTVVSETPPEFAGGSGTKDDPYQVATAAQLNNVRKYLGKHFIQIANIDLTGYLREGGDGYDDGKGWEPIGEDKDYPTYGDPFYGTYDGDNYIITGLTINRSDEERLGLFGYIAGRTVDDVLQKAKIENVKLKNVSIKGRSYIGSLVGQNYYHSEIKNCTAESIDMIASSSSAGGLIGRNSGTVTNCHTLSGTIVGGTSVGGLVGTANNGSISMSSADVEINGQGYLGALVGYNSYANIDQCYALGNATGWYAIGGLVGSHYNGTISNTYATGNVTSNERTMDCYVGGLIGMIGSGTIQNAYARGAVVANGTPTGPMHLGGLVGKLPDVGIQPTFTNCYYDTNTSGQTDTGRGTPKTTEEMKSLSTFVGWDFTSIWGINAEENSGYPFLRWQGYEHVSEFAGGDGSEANPYQVSTAEHLENVRDHIDKHFIQIADINLGVAPWNKGWNPIGNLESPFSGSYNGKGYEISNLYINGNTSDMGLFGITVSTSKISNVILTNIDITGPEFIGGIVGRSYGNIDNCSVTGSLTGIMSVGGIAGWTRGGQITNSYADCTLQKPTNVTGSRFGVLVGDNEAATISDCHATGSIEAYSGAGGLVGINRSEGTIDNSYATVDVTCTGNQAGGLAGSNAGSITTSYAMGTISGATYISGLVGYNSGSIAESYAMGSASGTANYIGGLVGDNFGSITNSYALVNVSGNTYVGGLAGCNSDGYGKTGSIVNAYATGSIIGSTSYGGLVGYKARASIVTNSFWNIETSGMTSSAAGTGKTKTEMSQQSTFNPWDFTDIWRIDEGLTYPYLLNNLQNPKPAPKYFAGGSGTEADPYQVATAEQLDKVRNYLDKHFIQTADIDLGVAPWNQGEGWEPIGTVGLENKFAGAFDGDGYKTSNLTINRPTTDYVGLFGCSSGVLKNIGLENVNVKGAKYTGGLLGMSDSGGYSEANYATGNVVGTQYVGGLAGGTPGNNLQIAKSYANVDVQGNWGVGGLVGMMYGSISNSYATGNVVGANGSIRVGGLVGEPYGNISNCYATGSVSGNGSEVGGLTGYLLSQSYEPISSYWDIETSGQATSKGGIGKTTIEMQQQVTYENWDFDSIWKISAQYNGGYPFLQWQ